MSGVMKRVVWASIRPGSAWWVLDLDCGHRVSRRARWDSIGWRVRRPHYTAKCALCAATTHGAKRRLTSGTPVD